MENITQLVMEIVQPQWVWIAFGFLVIVAIIMSLVFIYHWNRYGFGVTRTIASQVAYFIITGIILVSLFAIASSYEGFFAFEEVFDSSIEVNL